MGQDTVRAGGEDGEEEDEAVVWHESRDDKHLHHGDNGGEEEGEEDDGDFQTPRVDEPLPSSLPNSPTSSDSHRRMSMEKHQPLEKRDKHIFVLSSAGKPIFSRHGDEQQLAPLMGVIQAIISFSQEAASGSVGDVIRSIQTGKRR